MQIFFEGNPIDIIDLLSMNLLKQKTRIIVGINPKMFKNRCWPIFKLLTASELLMLTLTMSIPAY
jgi:hypothetical protein